METKQKSILIVGSATCRQGAAKGHDGDACRANLMSNGGVSCIFCGTSEAPDDAHRTRALDGLVVGVCAVLAPLSTTGKHEYTRDCPGGHGAEANGFDFKNLVRDTYLFAGKGTVTSARLQFFVTELPYAAAADTGYGVTLTDADRARLPEDVLKSVATLEKMGFCLRGQETALHDDPIEGQWLSLTRGTLVGKMGCVLGLNVRLKGKWPAAN
ncbi:MAG: hypothetical protein K2W95_34105 [Candidatus Obscuribacterales bacterium]|nr:hypothetical protein [Candidatus Obscuribacterales bacterium]